MVDDFEHLLALLFADEAKRSRDYTNRAFVEVPKEKPPPCKLDRLRQIWAAVMPQRELSIGDDKVSTKTKNGDIYEAKFMSDGERVCLYLIGNALCAPEDAVIIIDEPEIHLHRAIQPLLWDEIERARPDCAFVYITHDLDFAATRTGAIRVWLQSFDGREWVWEKFGTDPSLPDALMLQVLGNRRPLLFVEGDGTSHDAAIYSALYPAELVVSCQSCEKVIEATKAMRALPALHRLAVRGLVDRDRRSDDEVSALKAAGVLVADVAEVENLLCLPEVIEAVVKQINSPVEATKRVEAETAVFDELSKMIGQQALSRALAEIQFRMNGFGPKISQSDDAKLEAELQAYIKGIDVPGTVTQCRKLFEDVLEKRDYRAALRFFNCKGVISFVARKLGLNKDVYTQMVLGFVKGDSIGPVASAMRKAIE